MSFEMSMNRRSLLQTALLLAGATVAVGGCEMIAGEGRDEDFAFSEEQFALLSAVAATIVPKTETPGAVEIGVPKMFEGLMRDWASAERREELLSAMAEIDELGDKPFADLPPERRTALLKVHDAASLETGPPAVEGEGGVAIMRGPAYVNPGYSKLKQLIVVLYYYSEHGQTVELGYVHTPGVWEPSVPVTPETRPEGGLTRI